MWELSGVRGSSSHPPSPHRRSDGTRSAPIIALGRHSWHFHQPPQFITYKSERSGIRVERLDASHTSQRCSECGWMGTRDGDHHSCSEFCRGVTPT
nr:transposase [Halovivax ruber]